jgi:hypothetical protein
MSDNPYAAPQHTGPPLVEPDSDFEDQALIEEIIKDASHFWVAIPFCFCCAIIGLIVIPIWYLSRLKQCQQLQTKYPELLDENGDIKNLARRFRRAKLKFRIGLVGAGLAFLLYLLMIFG